MRLAAILPVLFVRGQPAVGGRTARLAPPAGSRVHRSMRSALFLLLSATLALACAAPRAPAEPVLLERGPHPVGFEQRWAFDARRAYRTAFDDGATYDGAARPILVSLWYPAARSAAALMPRADYLPIDGDARTAALATVLARHERDALARAVFGAPEAALAPA